MAPRYNHLADRLNLAVGDLLWWERQRDPHDPDAFGLSSRVGIEIHHSHCERRAREASEDFQSEVNAEWKGEIDGCFVTIHGRIDSFWRDDERTVIEEIKSTLFSEYSNLPLPSHRMQNEIYIWMMQESHPEDLYRGIVTYINPQIRKTIEFPFFPSNNIKAVVIKRIRSMINWYRMEAERLETRRNAYDLIEWPYPEYRDGQKEIIDSLNENIEKKFHLLISAPTGSGKTAPIMIESLRQCVKNNHRLAYATSRTVQQKSRVELLQLSSPPVAIGRVVLLGSRKTLGAKILAPDQEKGPFDPYAPPDWFLDWINKPIPIDPEDTTMMAMRYGLDPIQLQKEAAMRADILIGDQNLLANPDYIIPNWYLPHKEARKTVLLIDEIHGLNDRQRDRRAAKLSPKLLQKTISSIKDLSSNFDDNLIYSLTELETRLEEYFSTEIEDDQPLLEKIDPNEAVLIEPLRRIFSCINFGDVRKYETRLQDQIGTMMMALMALENPAYYAAYIDRQKCEIVWELVRSDLLLADFWKLCASVIGFSATIDPMELTKHDLGFPESKTDLLHIDDSMDRDQRLVVRYTGIPTTYNKRESSLYDLARLLRVASDSSDGKWLLFFPSTAYMESATREFTNNGIASLALRSGMPNGLIEKMSERKGGPKLHLALLGGSIAEGYDPISNPYQGIVIVSISQPPPSPRAELIKENLDERGEDGWLHSYLLPGLKRVQQAAGRLIRSPEQRGILILVDQRYARDDVIELLPPSWQESEIIDNIDDLSDSLKKWY
jgi:DNA excision repair protein ERCC-2